MPHWQRVRGWSPQACCRHRCSACRMTVWALLSILDSRTLYPCPTHEHHQCYSCKLWRFVLQTNLDLPPSTGAMSGMICDDSSHLMVPGGSSRGASDIFAMAGLSLVSHNSYHAGYSTPCILKRTYLKLRRHLLSGSRPISGHSYQGIMMHPAENWGKLKTLYQSCPGLPFWRRRTFSTLWEALARGMMPIPMASGRLFGLCTMTGQVTECSNPPALKMVQIVNGPGKHRSFSMAALCRSMAHLELRMKLSYLLFHLLYLVSWEVF